jgi:hypothetical protein
MADVSLLMPISLLPPTPFFRSKYTLHMTDTRLSCQLQFKHYECHRRGRAKAEIVSVTPRVCHRTKTAISLIALVQRGRQTQCECHEIIWDLK